MPEHTPSSPTELPAMQEQEPGLSEGAERGLNLLDGAGLTGPDTMQVALEIIRRHRRIHGETVGRMIGEDLPTVESRELLAGWALDHHRLCQAEALLEAVPIPLEEEDAPC
jgi:hypothetical protein